MKRRCTVQIKQKRYSAVHRANEFFHANTHAETDVVMTVQVSDVLSGLKRLCVVDTMMLVAFVQKTFPNVFVQIRASEGCLVATSVLENAVRYAVNTSAKRWL